MAFRTTADSVRAGLDRGDYKQPDDGFAVFAENLSAGLRASAKAKMQEDIDIRREKRAEARRVKAAADAAEKTQKKQDKLAMLFLNTQPPAVRESTVARQQINAINQQQRRVTTSSP